MPLAKHAVDPALAEVADLCIEARQALGTKGGAMLRLLLDMLLIELGRELAAAEGRVPSNGTLRPNGGSDG